MTLALSLGLLAVLAQGGGGGSGTTDTTGAVRPDTRLEMHLLGGDIVVHTWNRSAVRIEADLSERDRLNVDYGGAVLTVGASRPRGGPHPGDFTLTVPAAMDLSLSGTYSDITVEGTTGRVTLETVQGDITLHGGGGLVTALTGLGQHVDATWIAAATAASAIRRSRARPIRRRVAPTPAGRGRRLGSGCASN